MEEIVRKYVENGGFELKPKTNPVVKLREYDELKTRLSELFGAKVQLNCHPDGKGKISIPFASDEELTNIMDLLDKI